MAVTAPLGTSVYTLTVTDPGGLINTATTQVTVQDTTPPSLRIGNWSLTSLQQRLAKTGGRLVRHARYYWLLLAEGHLSWRLFGSLLRMIAALRCRTVSEPGQKVNERSEAVERGSVRREAGWSGKDLHSGFTGRPKRAHYHSKEARAG